MADRNKRSSASFVAFKPLDNLFEPTVQDKPTPTENGLTNLSVEDLHSFKDHPFRLYTEEKMAEMVESVSSFFVLSVKRMPAEVFIRYVRRASEILQLLETVQTGESLYKRLDGIRAVFGEGRKQLLGVRFIKTARVFKFVTSKPFLDGLAKILARDSQLSVLNLGPYGHPECFGPVAAQLDLSHIITSRPHVITSSSHQDGSMEPG